MSVCPLVTNTLICNESFSTQENSIHGIKVECMNNSSRQLEVSINDDNPEPVLSNPPPKNSTQHDLKPAPPTAEAINISLQDSCIYSFGYFPGVKL